jgi:hypothetical protein
MFQNQPKKSFGSFQGGNGFAFSSFDLQEEKKRIAEGTEEIKAELLAKWQKANAGAQIFPAKLASVNRGMADFLLSFENTLFYNDLAKKFNLTPEKRDLLPKLVWEICLSKNWSGAVSSINDQMQLAGIGALVNQTILIKARELSEKAVQPQAARESAPTPIAVVKINLKDALKNYPEIGEQLLSSARINSATANVPLRPSIKNWIQDYQYTVGYDSHDAVERGNYLFQSANTRSLNPDERRKLAFILKAIDENLSVSINKLQHQVIFSDADSTQPAQPTVTPPNYAPINIKETSKKLAVKKIDEIDSTDKNIGFSYAQKMPYEKKDLQPMRINATTPAPKPQPQIQPQRQVQFAQPQPKKEERLLPKNVVNLRELE